jgi:ABC-2 type transport system ATP-binding protein
MRAMSLRLERVSHRFGKQQVLEDVSLVIEPGDCYGFIGHNGAGKTTAMRVLLGLLKPDTGRVVVDGFDADRYPREARVRMGALIEQAGFHPHWSGPKNLRLLDQLAGGDSDIAALIEQVGLTHAREKPVRAYSQGMRQRLGVAQALLGNPDYVLLDEPSNGLDPDGIQEMRELIRHITRDEGHTVLISSHQLHELAGICNRVGVLRQGKLVMEDSIENLLRGDRYLLDTNDPERTLTVVEQLGLSVEGAGIHIGGREPSDVVKALVESGIAVSSFAPQPPTLEQIYHRDAEPVPPAEPIEVSEPERRAPPRPVGRMIGHEFRRWLGQWTVPAMLTIPAIAGVMAMLIRKGEATRDTMDIEAGTLASATAVNAFEGVARALHPGIWLLSYVILGLASQSVAGEYNQGTLRNVLLRPLTRFQVSFGKWSALLLTTVISYAVLAGVAIAGASMAFEWEGVVEILPNGEKLPIVPASDLWGPFWSAIGSGILPLLAYAGIGFFAGNLVHRGASALALALGAGVALDFGRGFVINSFVEPWIPTTYVPSPLGRTSYVDYYLELSQGVSNVKYIFGYTGDWSLLSRLTATDIAGPLLWIAATFVASAWVLKRRYVP